MNPITNLAIYEVEYSVSPGGIDMFEVYDGRFPSDPPLYESPDLTSAVQFCYNLGRDFTVFTLSEYHKEESRSV